MSGYIKRWNVDSICNQIQTAAYECSNPYHDGYTTWPIKQDLYRIKWAVDRALEQCPTYSPEEEFLKDHEQQRLIEILKQ